MGKGEIGLYEQFLLLPQCFQKTCTLNTENKGMFAVSNYPVSVSQISEHIKFKHLI